MKKKITLAGVLIEASSIALNALLGAMIVLIFMSTPTKLQENSKIPKFHSIVQELYSKGKP